MSREEICKHVAFTLVDSKVFDNDGTEIGCTGGGLIKCTDCETSVFELQQENTKLKLELRGLRKRLKGIEWSGIEYEHCPACEAIAELGATHKEQCWIKAEMDKLKGDE